MTTQTTATVQASALPASLTDSKHSHLIKIGVAIVNVLENLPGSDSIPVLFKHYSAGARKECSSFKPFTGEKWTTLCNSGRNGRYFRGVETCSGCQLLCADLHPSVNPHVKNASHIVPVSAMLTNSSSGLKSGPHKNSFGWAAAGPNKIYPEPITSQSVWA
jgi:hypothetical protein